MCPCRQGSLQTPQPSPAGYLCEDQASPSSAATFHHAGAKLDAEIHLPQAPAPTTAEWHETLQDLETCPGWQRALRPQPLPATAYRIFSARQQAATAHRPTPAPRSPLAHETRDHQLQEMA